MTLELQALTMLHMVGAGAYLGLAFDTFVRLGGKKKKAGFLFVQDLIFWLIHSVLIFVWLHSVNQGEMRVYVLLSILCGYAMYRALFQALYLKLLEGLVTLCLSLYRFIIRLITILIIKPIQWILRLITAVLLFLGGLGIQLIVTLYRFAYASIRVGASGTARIFVFIWKKIRRKN